jgi:hypothetical protein
VRGEAEDEDDVEPSVADDLVGDRDVTRLGVVCRRAAQRLRSSPRSWEPDVAIADDVSC